jgi:hypothetical protein
MNEGKLGSRSTAAPTGRVRVRYEGSFCRADLVQSRQKMTDAVEKVVEIIVES